MTIELPKEVLRKLPAPDSQGLVRVTAAIKLNERDGTATMVELNDQPMPQEKEESKDSPTGEETPSAPASEIMPTPGEVEHSIMQ